MIIYSSDGSNSDAKGLGPAGAAFVVNGANPQYFLLETGTNNQAEMFGFMRAVNRAALELKGDVPVIFHTDSQWLCYTVAGYLGLDYLPHYMLAVKNKARFEPMLDNIKRDWNSTFMTLKWIPREQNREADRAANIARERAIAKYGNKD